MIDVAQRRALHDYIERLRTYVDEVEQHRVGADPMWRERLDVLESEIDRRPEVEVALLGGTGAGKSTLVNALARKRILPVSSMRACTSAITEVAFGEGAYEVEVEFISRESWTSELYNLEQDIADHREATSETDPDLGIRKDAEDKIRTVYGESANQFFVSLDQRDLVEPAEVTDAFNAVTLASTFDADDEPAFREYLKRYLDSDHAFWPIVKRVRVCGPFEDLADGAVLVDLPGLNDPNLAREEATRQHLRSAQFVWVVFNMKRALTRDVFDYLREGDLLRQLFMDGRTGSLTFVGTASDDIDEDADIERLGLDEDASTVEIVRARAEAVQKEVRRQLEELGQLIVRDAKEDRETGSELLTELQRAPIHCVSAKEFQKIVGVMQKRSQLLRNPEDTGIPELHRHLSGLVAELGVEAHRSRLTREIDAVALDVERTVSTTRAAVIAQREATDAQLEEVRAAASESRRFLGEKADAALQTMDAQVLAGTELLRERLAKVADEFGDDLDALRDRWRGMHWATMRATTRRGGRWANRDRRIDLPEQIAKPILDGLSLAWVDFFGHRAVVATEVVERALADAVTDYVDRFELSCRSAPALEKLFEDVGRSTATTTQTLVTKRLADLRREVNDRLAADRKHLSERVTEQIALSMAPAFERAANQRGTGTKERMVAILHDAARETSDTMLYEIRIAIEELLSNLTGFMTVRTKQVIADLCAEADALARLVTETAEGALEETIAGQYEEQLASLAASRPMMAPASR